MARLQGSTTVSSAIVQSTTAESGEVDEFVAAIRFHRKLSFFSETAQKQLRVTYATVGSQVKDAPTILFAGGIYGGRYNGLWIDYLCATKGVRVILIDR